MESWKTLAREEILRVADGRFLTVERHTVELPDGTVLDTMPADPAVLEIVQRLDVGFQEWTPPSELVSSIISALQRKQSARESLLAEPRAPSPTGKSGSTSQLSWASTPFSKPSTTKFQSYKSSCTEFVPENLQPTAIQSGLDRLKITYGQLHRRSSPWGPTIPATTPSGR